MHDSIKGKDLNIAAETLTVESLLTFIEEEMEELHAALLNQDRREARLECADLGNYFMMLHTKLTSLDLPYGKRETDRDRRG